MWPWGHLAVGYLVYVVWARRNATPQRSRTLLVVAFATQLPDLIDKPLAWTLSVLPSGRSLGHSLFTATILVAVVYYLVRRDNRADVAPAFAIGYLSHCLSDLGPDVVAGVLTGDASQLRWATYLLWPLYPPPPYPHDTSFVSQFATFTLDPYGLFQFLLVALALAVWVRSGMPGVRPRERR